MLMQEYLMKYCTDEIVVTDTFINEWLAQVSRSITRRKLRANETLSDNAVNAMKYYTVYPKRQVIWKQEQ